MFVASDVKQLFFCFFVFFVPKGLPQRPQISEHILFSHMKTRVIAIMAIISEGGRGVCVCVCVCVN